MRNILFLTMVFLMSCSNMTQKKQLEENKYKTTWESLSQHHEEPEWFQDAKLGIYFHWGVYSVPAYRTEWYPRHMHMKNGWDHSDIYNHHVETYGEPTEFPYPNFVPLFKAEKFNAIEWAQLFKKAGAKFAGPVAEHHDGFALWDSQFTPWNAMDKGPKRDLTGELEKAIKAEQMKFITTFHHARNNLYEIEPGKWEGHFNGIINDGFESLLEHSENAIMYGYMPREEFLEMWENKLEEVIDNYQPDIIWFDSWLDEIPEEYRQEFCAYYLNAAESWDKEVVIVRKQNDLPLDCSVDDLEKSRKNKLGEKVWMTDETISKGSWCYTEDLPIKEAKDVLHVLIDIVSKNGVLLLNISPMADGSIPDNQKDVLLSMGDWLSKYGEAIYETRPWYTFGEGPTVEPEGHFQNHEEFLKIKYSAKDIRYTTKGNAIYAIVLGHPEEKSLQLKSFAVEHLPSVVKIKKISSLETGESLKWDFNEEGLKINIPNQLKNTMAQVFKIEIEE